MSGERGTTAASFLKFYFEFIDVSQIQFRDNFNSDQENRQSSGKLSDLRKNVPVNTNLELQFRVCCSICRHELIAFDKERLRNAVEIDTFGLSLHGYQFGLPRKIIQGRNYSGRMMQFPSTTCFVSSMSRVSRFASRLIGVLSCRV